MESMAMKISDEISKWCDNADVDGDACVELYALADRIDREMVELPKDMDGVPIHVGDLAYLGDKRRLDYGRRVCVTEIDIKDGCVVIDCWDGSKHVAYHPSGITRNLPDSWNFIANELDELVDAAHSADDSCEKLADLADRIRKLAKDGGQK